MQIALPLPIKAAVTIFFAHQSDHNSTPSSLCIPTLASPPQVHQVQTSYPSLLAYLCSLSYLSTLASFLKLPLHSIKDESFKVLFILFPHMHLPMFFHNNPCNKHILPKLVHRPYILSTSRYLLETHLCNQLNPTSLWSYWR